MKCAITDVLKWPLTSLTEYPCEEKETCLYLLSGDFSQDAFAHHLPFGQNCRCAESPNCCMRLRRVRLLTNKPTRAAFFTGTSSSEET